MPTSRLIVSGFATLVAMAGFLACARAQEATEASPAPTQKDAGPAQKDAEPPPPPARSEWRIELEYLGYGVGQNLVQRPNNADGTRFDVNTYAGSQINTGRVTAFAPLNVFRDGDELRLVIAPFRQSGTATPVSAVLYDYATFKAGVPLKVQYQFDTYRLTYDLPIFSAARSSGWELRIGGTIALRAAQINLSQPGLVRNMNNQGPVPLLYFSAVKDFGPSWHAVAEFDGFPAPGGGGLFDGSLKLAYDLTRNVTLTGGVRYEIGGAVETSLYTHFNAVAGVFGVNLRF